MLNLLPSAVKTLLFMNQNTDNEGRRVPAKLAMDTTGGQKEELDFHLIFDTSGDPLGKLLIVPDDPVTITKGPSDLPFEQFSTKKRTSVKNRKWIDIQDVQDPYAKRMRYSRRVSRVWFLLNGDPIDLLGLAGCNKMDYELQFVCIKSVMIGSVPIEVNAGIPLIFDDDEEFTTVQYPVFICDPKVVHEPAVDTIYGIIDTKNKIARLHSVNRLIHHVQFDGFVVGKKEQTNADKNKD